MEKVFVAKLGKTVGLKGQLKIYIDSDFPEQFKKGAKFITNKNKTLTIESINFTNKTVKFAELHSIEDATKYINSELLTTQEDTIKNCELKENQYFWFDLIGSQLIENGKILGTIKDIHRYPLDDYFEISTNTELITSENKLAKTFLVPYNDNYILDVNIENKTITTKDCLDLLYAS